MHFFSDSIQPITQWLELHPQSALFITFIIAFAESLAIIGSIIPGSVTMTAVGILAGSGTMRIDLTLLAATLGAIAGDSSSYLLGYFFSETLVNIWPFSKYPSLLAYGKDYFARHGGKSVLVGRFVGPLRSIIPVIAGMMKMSQWRFFIANCLSALGWAILYVFPGILIGAASSELSPESATHLFMLVLAVLAGLWLISMLLRWIFKTLNRLLRANLNDLWFWSKKHPLLRRVFRTLSPKGDKNQSSTALLLVLFLFSSFVFIALLLSVLYLPVSHLDYPLHLLLQSFRTSDFDVFFAFIYQFSSPISLGIFTLTVACISLYYRDWRACSIWLGSLLTCLLITKGIHHWIIIPRPPGIVNIKCNPSFPAQSLAFLTTSLSLCLFFLSSHCQAFSSRLFKIAFISLIVLSASTSLYLDDHWLTDILGGLTLGFSIACFGWLIYRRFPSLIPCGKTAILYVVLPLLLAAGLSAKQNVDQTLSNHQPFITEYAFTEDQWWNQESPLLPIYRTNRLGHPISYFNIQYFGSLEQLEKALLGFGWRKLDDSMFNSFLIRVSGDPATKHLPLLSQLYLNKKPTLFMTYQPLNNEPLLVLRIWESNYHVSPIKTPIWIGSVHPRTPQRFFLNSQKLSVNTQIDPTDYIRQAEPDFLYREILFPDTIPLPIPTKPLLLLIKETPSKKTSNKH